MSHMYNGDPKKSGTKLMTQVPKDYSDGRTIQSFKDETDINKLIHRAAKGETISHLEKHGAIYGDFTDVPDLLEAQERLARGQRIFDELPAEVRREFGQSPARFFAFVNDPANKDDLARVLPGLAEPGRQLPVIKRTAKNMGAEGASGEAASPPAAPEPASPPISEDSTSPSE